jgi:hypothetical protein
VDQKFHKKDRMSSGDQREKTRKTIDYYLIQKSYNYWKAILNIIIFTQLAGWSTYGTKMSIGHH